MGLFVAYITHRDDIKNRINEMRDEKVRLKRYP